MDRSQIAVTFKTFRIFATTRTLVISILLGAYFLGGSLKALAAPTALPAFKLHFKAEPPTLDPALMTEGLSAYLFSNIQRGLIRYSGTGELIFDQAERCMYKYEGILVCTLRKTAKWDDGAQVKAQEFVERFQKLLSPGSHFPYLSLLMNLRNAKEVLSGKKPVSELGVKALSPTELQFDLVERDNEFVEKLSHPLLTPYRKPKDIKDYTSYFSNGPYKIASWIKHQKITLEPNPNYSGYDTKHEHPNVEIIFVPEDSSAVSLYEKGVINFLWRLPDSYVDRFKNRPDYVHVPMSRFDYVGFNLKPGSPFENKELRKLFVTSLQFKDFKKVLRGMTNMGCPGLNESLITSEDHCLNFEKSDSALATLSTPPQFYFSLMGGDDIKRQVEWFQEQWHSNLKTKVELKGLDQKQFLGALNQSPSKVSIFRKGVMLARPTCLAALEPFQKDNPDNHTGFNNLRFENLTKALWAQKMTASEKQSVCGVAFDLLFKEEFVGIPLGPIEFNILATPQFKGWNLNDLNQLDLTGLYVAK